MNLIGEGISAGVWSQLWQVTVLIAVVAVVVWLCCRRKPHLSYLLWMLVLVKCVTPPLWSSPAGVFSWVQSNSIPEMTAITAPADPTISQKAEIPDEFPLDEFPGGSTAAAAGPVNPVSVWTVVAVIWLGGALLLACIVIYKWVALYHRLKKSTQPTDSQLAATAAKLREQLGIRRPVHVLVTSEPLGPAVFGFFRPSVILPQTLLDNSTAADIEPILAHELVHIRRLDAAAAGLQVVVQLIWWFHPLAWWANCQTSRERERCCDEETVAGLGYLPTDYARSLLDVVVLKRRLRSAFAAPGIRPPEITSKRVEDIMQRSGQFHRRTPRWYWGVILVAAALILPGAGLVFDPEQVSAEQKPAAAGGTKKLNITKGGGWLYNLPADGAWAQYKSEVLVEGRDGGRSNVMTMRCVGTVEIDDKKCRWIELENQITSTYSRDPLRSSNSGVNTFTWKLLFPEKSLLDSERPLDHLIAGWRKMNDEDPSQIPIPLPRERILQNSAFVRAIFPGPVGDPKELKPEVIESKLGMLACRGVVAIVERPNVRRSEYRTRLHEKAPFGVVTITHTTSGRRNGKQVLATRKSKLVDFGTNAKSAMPDKGYEPKK